jgi:uncharacterized RDD family membrane protein YckC
MASKSTKKLARADGLPVTTRAAAPEGTAQTKPADRVYPRDPASPLLRLYAWLIDAAAIVMLVMVIGRLSRGAFFSAAAAPQDIVLFLAYFIVPTGIWGRTLGKWVAGIVVIDEHGRPPGVAAAIPREVAWKALAIGSAGLGILWAVFDKERRGLHDRLAGTWVVHVPDAGGWLLGRLFNPKRPPNST